MFVTISGSSGTGKTTLCNAFKSRNPGWELVPEIIDTTIKPQNDPILRQIWFLSQYIEREKKLASLGGKNIIADRDWIDCLMYARLLGGYDVIERLYINFQKTEPDLRVILTLPEESIIKRAEKRNRALAGQWKETDMNYINRLNSNFIEYHNAFSDLKPVVLLDSSLPPMDLCKKLEKIIESHVS